MDDQGEKIVFLARALLNGTPENFLDKKALNVTMTFKALCLTTILAAAGGGAVTAWAHENERPLNRYERFEVQALVFYASKLKGMSEDSLRRDVEKKIGVTRFDEMTAGEFSAAVQYLQEKAQ